MRAPLLLLFYERLVFFFCFSFLYERSASVACLSEAAAASPAFITSPFSLSFFFFSLSNLLLLPLAPLLLLFTHMCACTSRPLHFCKVLALYFSNFDIIDIFPVNSYQLCISRLFENEMSTSRNISVLLLYASFNYKEFVPLSHFLPYR